MEKCILWITGDYGCSKSWRRMDTLQISRWKQSVTISLPRKNLPPRMAVICGFRWWHRLWWDVLDRKLRLLNSRSQEQRQVYTYRCRVETQPHLDIALQFCLMLIVCILNILLIVYNDFKYTRFLSIKQTDIN